MKVYLSRIKQCCMIILAMSLAFVFCSCANKEWITKRKEQVFNRHINKMQKELDEKIALLNVNTDRLMGSARLQAKEINSSTSDFENSNAKTLQLIKRLARRRQEYLAKMKLIDEQLRISCMADDKLIFKKTYDDVKRMSRKKVQDWKKYSIHVYTFSVKEYKYFFKKTTLYRLAELPMQKKMYNPINAKTMQLLDLPIKAIEQKKNNLLGIKDKLEENMKLQELLYVYNSLQNCRVAAEKLIDSEIIIPSWQHEESIISSLLTSSRNSDQKKSDYFQVLLYNRIMVCDFMVRRLKSSQKYPLEIAYFMDQLKNSNKHINDKVWKKNIYTIIVGYINNFNTRNAMSEENKL
jgi:hypothetical protein